MKTKFLKLNSRTIEEILKELDKIESEEKSTSFTNIKDTYICPECLYLGVKCDRGIT